MANSYAILKTCLQDLYKFIILNIINQCQLLWSSTLWTINVTAKFISCHKWYLHNLSLWKISPNLQYVQFSKLWMICLTYTYSTECLIIQLSGWIEDNGRLHGLDISLGSTFLVSFALWVNIQYMWYGLKVQGSSYLRTQEHVDIMIVVMC